MNIEIFKTNICISQGEVACTEAKWLETNRIANNTMVATKRKLFLYVCDHYFSDSVLLKKTCPWLKEGTPYP